MKDININRLQASRFLIHRSFIPIVFWVMTIVGLWPAFPNRARAAQQAMGSPGSLIFRSEDQGEHWTAVSSLPNVVELAADPAESEIVYASGWSGLYKSGDGGTTWSKVGNSLPAGSAYTLVFDPRNSSTLYTTAAVSDSSTASYRSLVAPESIASLFGPGLTTGTDQASSLPLPVSLRNSESIV